MSADGPRVGLWGRFDGGTFADAALPAIYEREIRRRLPAARVEPYAPLPEPPSGSLAAAFTAVDLGEWSPRRAAELADALDCVIVAGDAIETPDPSLGSAAALRGSRFFVEGLGDEAEASRPRRFVWSAVGVPRELDRAGRDRVRRALARGREISVRDEASRDRLARAGAEAGDVAVLPDPLLLLPRAFGQSERSKRLDYLRHMEWYPRGATALVVAGERALAGVAESVARELEDAVAGTDVAIVLVELDPGRGDGEFLDELEGFLRVPAFRLPREATLADVVAALADARGFLGCSERGRTAAEAFGTPTAPLVAPAGRRGRAAAAKPHATASRSAEEIRALLRAGRAQPDPDAEKALDAHFDLLAEIAESSSLARLREEGDPTAALRRRVGELERRIELAAVALEARSRQVVESRLRIAGMLEENSRHSTAARESAAALERSRSEAAAEVDRLRAEAATLGEKLSALADAEAAARAALETARSQAEARESELAAELARKRADENRLEAGLERSRSDVEALRKAVDAARGDAEEARRDAERRVRRADAQASELRSELDRAASRLERARSEQAEVRLSQTLLFAELAEARSEASRAQDVSRTRGDALARAEAERDSHRAEAARLAAEVERLTGQLDQLRASAGRSALRGVKGGRG